MLICSILEKESIDIKLIQLLRKDKEAAIEQIFRLYYPFVCTAVIRIIPNKRTAEDIAQDVFLGLWKKKENLQIKTSLKAYLRRSAVNRALNYVRDHKIILKKEEPDEIYAVQTLPDQLLRLETEELQKAIDKIIDQLPERCRLVFVLNRFENFSYKEIAAQLNISSKTVENQISKALKILREKLAPLMNNE